MNDPDPRPSPPVPPDLVALTRDDGDVVILSFALPESDAETVLTPAESRVLRHVLDGRTNAEIAELRATSPRTVANQIAGLFRKLGVSSRMELIARPQFALFAGRGSEPPAARRDRT